MESAPAACMNVNDLIYNTSRHSQAWRTATTPIFKLCKRLQSYWTCREQTKSGSQRVVKERTLRMTSLSVWKQIVCPRWKLWCKLSVAPKPSKLQTFTKVISVQGSQPLTQFYGDIAFVTNPPIMKVSKCFFYRWKALTVCIWRQKENSNNLRKVSRFLPNSLAATYNWQQGTYGGRAYRYLRNCSDEHPLHVSSTSVRFQSTVLQVKVRDLDLPNKSYALTIGNVLLESWVPRCAIRSN